MIELRNISKTYQMGRVEVRALRDISLRIEPGEFVAIMGASGSGKSTLMHILGCLDRPDRGVYRLAGREINALSDNRLALLRNHWFGFVFQQFYLLSHLSALENAELPLIYAGSRDRTERARGEIEAVGLGKRGNHHPNEMSGGEQQRVAIARALVNNPPIILADEPTGNLDSQTTAEILNLLEELNREGKTVIMVTHEKELAGRARRVITLSDGKIVSDKGNGIYSDGWEERPTRPGQAERKSGTAVLTDQLRQAVHSIISHKLRTFLSMLGILIGVGAVIAMLALGAGAQKSIEDRLSSLGTNLLSIRPGSRHLRGVSGAAGEVTRFTAKDSEAMQKLPQITRASAQVQGQGQLVYRDKNWNTRIYGVEEDYAPMRAYKPEAGRFFTGEEMKKRERVAVIGQTVVHELFGEENPLGEFIRINRNKFRIIGVLPQKGSSPWRDQDDVVMIPLTTAMYRVLGKDYVDAIDVEVADQALMASAEESLKTLIRQRHRLRDDNEESFRIRNMAEIQEVLKGTTETMGLLLGSIAAISLLVGGIGIMNIMLVSVRERTREIGLRKAIGARKKDIMIQFLIEAVLMTLSGGITGIILGVGIALTMSEITGWTVAVTPESVTLAAVFSGMVGLIFGLWPARQAARLDPIDALRYE